jgi:hypothetical protein
MAATEVGICNMALGNIGISMFISSLSEASNEARVCSTYYEPARDMVLRDFPWNCSKSFSVLADLGTPPTNWGYRYALPSDCITVRFIVVAGIRTPRKDQRIPFEIAVEGGVRVLYTNQPEAEICYSCRVVDPNLFDPLMVIALSWLLASFAAMPLSSVPSLADSARKGYANLIASAGAADLREAEEGPEPECEFLTGRG